MKILAIEDNEELASSIYDYLAHENYICELAYNMDQAREKLLFYSYDCIVLDIMLPDGNGLELLHFMKSEHIQSPILIVSAKGALDDRIQGLESGADDYLTKPFYLPELHARLRAIHRRKNLDGNSIVSFKEITLNTNTFELQIYGKTVDITKKEFELLLYFLVNKNRVISRQAIANHLWGDYTDNLSNLDFVYQHVKNLRKKINHAGGEDYISTVYGLGYKFNIHKT
ncbi:response regulator transcription factor [Olivibacter sp. SDN3]|uniref:response regulator transcription factor n=1 Tax=Olivibacter sp. SDN3 TaxID=2764720 RepID=UPI0016518951|nr:response regulator transcription factor [Olivibacter sp. SDN3]QNL49196.1 response regulator transcription factor [Olivibacter sp. SDN3]